MWGSKGLLEQKEGKMKRKKKKAKVKNRLPWGMVVTLRRCGGPHSSKKGKRGYNRQRDGKASLDKLAFHYL